MKIKLLFAALLLVPVLLISCKKEEEKPLDNSTEIVYSETAIDTFKGVKNGDTLQKIKNTIKILSALKNNALKDLNQASREDGNRIYEDYRKAAEIEVGKLNDLQGDFLANYYNYYEDKKKDFVFPTPLNLQVNAVKEGGLEYWEVGEGYAEIRFKANHYYNLFKGKVTEDYEYYLKTEAKEESVLAFADAAVIISLEELGERVLSWEKFMHDYPASALLSKATNNYQWYGWVYLFGLDNTSTIEFSDGTMYEENRKEFKRFIAQNPNSHFAGIVKLFLAKFDKAPSHDELRKFVNKELNIDPKKRPEYEIP